MLVNPWHEVKNLCFERTILVDGEPEFVQFLEYEGSTWGTPWTLETRTMDGTEVDFIRGRFALPGITEYTIERWRMEAMRYDYEELT